MGEVNMEFYTTGLTGETDPELGLAFDDEESVAIDPEWRQKNVRFLPGLLRPFAELPPERHRPAALPQDLWTQDDLLQVCRENGEASLCRGPHVQAAGKVLLDT